ncbi:MAG: AAA family ATPase [Cuspidothrix sp.]
MSEQPQINQSIIDNVHVGGNLTTGDIYQTIYSQSQQLEGNPFKPPQPREGGPFGREEELEKLHQLLQSGKNVCVVSGMGGIGKTGLVREYASLPKCTSLFPGGVYILNIAKLNLDKYPRD